MKAVSFIFFLFYLSGNVFGQDPEGAVPDYEHLSGVDLGTAGTSSTENIIISIAVDSQGYIYTLSFGNGVDKLNPDGSINQAELIPGAELQSPLDIEIDSAGKIYIADYFESGSCLDNGKVKIFSSNGSLENEIAYSYFRPLGLAIDINDNIYVAEYYDGSTCETGEESRVRIFDINGVFLNETNFVEIPYRLAVDSKFTLYVSQAGEDNPQVLYFDSDLNFQGTFSDIISPGSIVVDRFDFIHVIEYAGRVDFEKFLNYDQLGFLELLVLASGIQQGINNNEFGFKIFNPNKGFEFYYQDDEIRFPVDLSINELICDSKLYLNNANIDGTALQFDLEAYKRTPSFDIINPIANCVGNFELSLVDGSVSITVDDINNSSTDNCGIENITLSQSTFTEADVYDVTMTVTDQAGNKDTCTVQVTVIGDEPQLTITDCDNSTVNVFFNENCKYKLEDYRDDFTASAPGATIKQDPSPGTMISDDQVVTLTPVLNGEEGQTCKFTVSPTDSTKPFFNNCPTEDIAVSLEEGETYRIPDYSTQINYEDNCDTDLEYSQVPETGEEITETTTVILTVTDDAGLQAQCSFDIIITDEPVDTPPEFENCPEDKNVKNDSGQCVAVVTFDTPTVIDDNGSVTPTRIDGNTDLNSGDEFPVGVTTIIFEANDGVNNAVNCSFTITVTDAEDPVISCPDNKVESFDSATGYEVPDFTDEVEVSDNCTSSNDLIITQSPQEGDFITESQAVTITVEDSAGLKDSCNFQLTLEEQQQYEFKCIGDLTVRLGEDAQNSNVTEIETSEFITSDISNLDLELRVQQFTCEDIGTNPITIRASEKDTGEDYSCTVNVTVVDVGEPLIICPFGVQTREIPAGGVYELPDFSEVYSISDNCSDYEDLVFTQDPLPGTEYTEEGDYEIVLTATDIYNNTETCEVTYRLIKSAQPSFECPVVNEIDPIIKDGDCNYEVPDYSSLITNFQNFSNTPFISSEYVKNDDFLSVSLEVYNGENGDFVGDCIFEVPAIDNTAPNFDDCSNRNLSITIAEGSFWNLEDFTDDFTAVDNCDSDLEFTQDPVEGTPINETTDVAVRVTDESGNTKSCLFTVNVTIVDDEEIFLNCPGEYEISPNDNCEYIVPQFSDILNFGPTGTEIEQSLEAGSILELNTNALITITATFENETETCEIDLKLINEFDVVCPEDKTENITEGEEFMLPDYRNELNFTNNCNELEIIQTPAPNTIVTEDVEINFTVIDGSGNTSACSFNLDLVEENDLSINCPGNKIFDFDEDCSFTLPDFREEAEVNNGEGLEITQSPSPGTVLTEMITEVTLSLEESNTSCSFLINLQDNTAPVLNLRDISISLDLSGNAILRFQDIDNGSFDNCDANIQYTLSRSNFNCKNLGENLIQVVAEDADGNISNGTVVVTVIDEQGICDNISEGSEYIFIYPNPNTGSFKIATPADVIIERVEVFDHRGRFLASKDYESTVTEYALDLGPLQEAVYVLKIITEEEIVTKRFIFKN